MWDYSTVLYLYNLNTYTYNTHIYIYTKTPCPVTESYLSCRLQPVQPFQISRRFKRLRRIAPPHFGGATRKRGQHQTGVPPHGKATRLVHPVVSRIVKTCPRQNHYPHLKNKFCGWLSRIQKDLRGSKRQWGTIILFYELVLKRCPFS